MAFRSRQQERRAASHDAKGAQVRLAYEVYRGSGGVGTSGNRSRWDQTAVHAVCATEVTAK